MTAHSPLVTIIGGSGFVGRQIAQCMARRGWRVRVACRRPNEAMSVKPYGTVGQVEPVQRLLLAIKFAIFVMKPRRVPSSAAPMRW